MVLKAHMSSKINIFTSKVDLFKRFHTFRTHGFYQDLILIIYAFKNKLMQILKVDKNI